MHWDHGMIEYLIVNAAGPASPTLNALMEIEASNFGCHMMEDYGILIVYMAKWTQLSVSTLMAHRISKKKHLIWAIWPKYDFRYPSYLSEHRNRE